MPRLRLAAAPAALLMLVAATATAAPVTYKIDPAHTYPSFETDHWNGLSVWRGKFNRTQGSIVLDREAGTGTVELQVDISSVDLGHDELNKGVLGPDILDAAQFPVAVYKGRLTDFDGGAPEKVEGELTLHGVTRPLTLDIESFKCIDNHPIEKVEVCGADAEAEFNRGDFDVNFALDHGFKPTVKLRIQVEAQRQG